MLIRFYLKPNLCIAAPKSYASFFGMDCQTEKISNVLKYWTKYFFYPCNLSCIMMLMLLLYLCNNHPMLSIKKTLRNLLLSSVGNIEKFIPKHSHPFLFHVKEFVMKKFAQDNEISLGWCFSPIISSLPIRRLLVGPATKS